MVFHFSRMFSLMFQLPFPCVFSSSCIVAEPNRSNADAAKTASGSNGKNGS